MVVLKEVLHIIKKSSLNMMFKFILKLTGINSQVQQHKKDKFQ
jgi:hypothetical protein